MRLVPLCKEPQESFLSLPSSSYPSLYCSLSPSLPFSHNEKAICKAGRVFSPELHHAGTIISDFQLPELGEIHFCHLRHPDYGIFVIAA